MNGLFSGKSKGISNSKIKPPKCRPNIIDFIRSPEVIISRIPRGRVSALDLNIFAVNFILGELLNLWEKEATKIWQFEDGERIFKGRRN